MNIQRWTKIIKRDTMDMIIIEMKKGAMACIVLSGSRMGNFTSKQEGMSHSIHSATF